MVCINPKHPISSSWLIFSSKFTEDLGSDEESGKDWSDLEREAAEEDRNHDYAADDKPRNGKFDSKKHGKSSKHRYEPRSHHGRVSIKGYLIRDLLSLIYINRSTTFYVHHSRRDREEARSSSHSKKHKSNSSSSSSHLKSSSSKHGSSSRFVIESPEHLIPNHTA